MATMQIRMWMRMKKNCKLMMVQRRMWRTEAIVGLTCEPVMSMGMRARIATMRILMRRKKHHKPIMDKCRIWMTEGIVLESVKIGHYISDI